MVQSKKCKYDLKVKGGLVENRVFLGTTEKKSTDSKCGVYGGK